MHETTHIYIKQDRGGTKFVSESKIFFDFEFCMENGKKWQILAKKWNSSISSSQTMIVIVTRFVHPLGPSIYFGLDWIGLYFIKRFSLRARKFYRVLKHIIDYLLWATRS